MKKFYLTIIRIILLLFCIMGTVQAVTSAEIEERRKELIEQIEQSGIEIENIQIELTETLEKINEIDKQIYDYEENIKQIDEDLKTIEQDIEEKEKEIKIIQLNYDQVKEAFAERMVYLYETNDTRYLDVLLNSKSIVEFISNYYLIGEMAEYDANLIEKIENNKDRIVEAKEELQQVQQQLEEKKKKNKRLQ